MSDNTSRPASGDESTDHGAWCPTHQIHCAQCGCDLATVRAINAARNRAIVRRCEAQARKGTGYGICDRPLDEHGNCDRASDHGEPMRQLPEQQHGDDFENWSTKQLRTELDKTQRILQNKRRYQLTETLIAQLSGRRVRLEQVLMQRAGTEWPLGIDKPRRARATSGTTFDMGREPGHPWPLEYAPRWATDHHPWRIATAPDNGIRFASHEIEGKPALTKESTEESGVQGETDTQPETNSD